jgi:hypothetical protein
MSLENYRNIVRDVHFVIDLLEKKTRLILLPLLIDDGGGSNPEE